MALWTPTNLDAPPTAWWDATQLTGLADGDTITSWPDVSGDGHALTASGNPTYQTGVLNGNPVVRLDGTGDCLTEAAAQNFDHIFVVASYEFATFDNYDGLLTDTLTGLYLIGSQGTAKFYPVGAPQVTCKDGTVLAGNVGGPMSGAASMYSVSKTGLLATGKPLLVGLDRNIAGRYWNGDVAEVIGFASVLSTDDRQLVEGYMAHRWGIASQLPADHPFKLAAPSVNPDVLLPTEVALTPIVATATVTARLAGASVTARAATAQVTTHTAKAAVTTRTTTVAVTQPIAAVEVEPVVAIADLTYG